MDRTNQPADLPSTGEATFYALNRAGVWTAQFITKLDTEDNCILYFRYKPEVVSDELAKHAAQKFLERQYRAYDISFWRNPNGDKREFYAKFKRG